MNWKQLLADLAAADLTQAEIAKFCGCSQPTISEIGRGVIADPKHSIGALLVKLHADPSAARAQASA